MERYCTKCGATLDYQDGFDESEGYWRCTECGTMLIDPEIDDSSSLYPGVVWVCDECGAILNKQFMFSDYQSEWTCTECGHVNEISSFAIEKENDDDSLAGALGEALAAVTMAAAAKVVKMGLDKIKSKNSDDSNTDEDDQQEDDEEEEEYVEPEKVYIRPDVIYSNPQSSSKKEGSNKAFIALIIAIICIALGYAGITKLNQLIPAAYSLEECVGQPYEEVMSNFISVGYETVEAVAMNDLSYEELSNNGLVKSVTIGNKTNFSAKTKFSYHNKVTVFYHSAKSVFPPYNSKDVSDKTYQEAKDAFINMGFGDIELQEKESRFLEGLFVKNGLVDSITIDGQKKFTTESEYKVDAKVVIIYHVKKD